ncbi:MAG: CCA tRNA nucleotidyltransferase [Candidatus Rokubacteria bacterium]|nr:CCA tRNA nucleotidyltransferase [Candidatus Rokubacteria bacterium]
MGEALRLARHRQAGIVAAGGARFALREDLARASLLGLDALAVRRLARPLPVVGPRTSEVGVRRRLARGAPAVVVSDRRGPIGAVGAAGVRRVQVGSSLGRRFVGSLPAPTRELIGAVGAAAVACGARAFLVGGLVRDILRGGLLAPRDLDVVIEGDGLAVARALAAALALPDRALVEHQRFLTASLAVPAAGRVDIVTARAERYETPGALPRVMPAPLLQDLARRDFTINAMAVELQTGDFALLDFFGGRDDLEHRRLRVLHPLSFVEDPTRIFRAARYATRLGFRLDAWTAQARTLALGLAPYPSLSGQRLATELELILDDVRPPVALRHLGAAGAFRLFDPRHRFTRRTAGWIAAVPATRDWVERHHLQAPPVEVACLALTADQPDAVAARVLGRLGFSGAPRERLERALAAPRPAGRPGRRVPASGRARTLRDRSDLELAWAWLATPARRATLTWYVMKGRGVRPQLRGDEVAGLGVPPGPAVAAVLGALRDARLDGVVTDRGGEVAYVQHWIGLRKEG